ncbi:prepilin-type N-terminal cleavage/methylation domain-containing protein [Synechococcus sp. ATX 2A4]|uniref:pilus assembly FimT family protein n=1 Tax=Synechococcus sp. ATX 2A4 TaxID=2823727 RepID=UPI0020CD2F69|nr:prepilin-type N-terminal cleavage/methylation domain-containing protein [Synechococcus sp. ATX 2A4]MCP9885625.1 prepilin-type N-terminal cleavage/methylation domain-containing protein [Synechococcus sp. ATX 2A4]
MTPTLPPRRSPVRGFTLIELLVGIVVFTSLISITYSFTAAEIRREEVNSLAIELASWLKVVQNTAQVRPGSTSTTLANGCTITFTGATGNLVVPGSPLASVAPAACSPNAGFNIPTGSSSRRGFRATITGGTGTPPNQVVFTPRGTVTATNNVTLQLRLEDSALIRCVRVGATIGQVSIGANNNDDQATNTTCDEGSFGGRF